MTRDEYLDDLADELGAHETLAALAEPDAVTPPGAIRSRLLAAIGDRPRAGAAPVSAPALYARRVVAMAALLAELDGDEWSATAAPYRWSVHRLVAHLTAIEEYTARQLGLGNEAPFAAGDPAVADHLRTGAEGVERLAAGSPAATVARWTVATERIGAHVGSDAFDPSRAVPLHSWPFDAATALVVRAFEIWTHADDIRRATGRSLDVPSAGELRAMSTTSVRGLPALLALGGEATLTPTRVVLTGAGGGTFDLAVADGGEGAPRSLLVADVVDYCRLVARRIAPDALDATRDGDMALIGALLRAAQLIAV